MQKDSNKNALRMQPSVAFSVVILYFSVGGVKAISALPDFVRKKNYRNYVYVM